MIIVVVTRGRMAVKTKGNRITEGIISSVFGFDDMMYFNANGFESVAYTTMACGKH